MWGLIAIPLQDHLELFLCLTATAAGSKRSSSSSRQQTQQHIVSTLLLVVVSCTHWIHMGLDTDALKVSPFWRQAIGDMSELVQQTGPRSPRRASVSPRHD